MAAVGCAGKELFATALVAAETEWMIFVSVGYDGTEMKLFTKPEEHIERLKAEVMAEIGEVVGKAHLIET